MQHLIRHSTTSHVSLLALAVGGGGLPPAGYTGGWGHVCAGGKGLGSDALKPNWKSDVGVGEGGRGRGRERGRGKEEGEFIGEWKVVRS